MKMLYWLLSLSVIGTGAYFLGPKAPAPQLDPMIKPISFDNMKEIEKHITIKDNEEGNIKEGNESKIIWWDEKNPSMTDYVVLYLHGFSSSPEEGAPLHRNFAKRYGANLYLPRLMHHGLITERPLDKLTPENYLSSAREALEVAQSLGKKVVLMACSTGGTLGLYLTANNPEAVHSLILYSPNIDLADPTSFLLTKPWGRNIAEIVLGSDMRKVSLIDEEKAYWYNQYSIDGIIAMKSLINHTMNEETFKKIKQPVYLGYFYKNEKEADEVVSIPRMLEMYKQLGTSNDLKHKKAFADAGAHVICSEICSKESDNVESDTFVFAEEILKIKPKK